MAGKITRIVPRSSLTVEQVGQIFQRQCMDCFLDSFNAYVDETPTEHIAFGFCEMCPFSKMPMDTITAYPLHEYLAWVYICEPSDLIRILAEQADHAEGLLLDKFLVFERDGTTQKLHYAGLAPPDAPFPVPEHVDGVPLKFPAHPHVLHNDDGWMYKIPMELVYNSYPARTQRPHFEISHK